MIGSLTSGSIKQMSVDHLASTSQGAYTVVTGQVEAGVTGVTLVRSDGEQVQTSVSNGLFVAWWPGPRTPPRPRSRRRGGRPPRRSRRRLHFRLPGAGPCKTEPSGDIVVGRVHRRDSEVSQVLFRSIVAG